MIHGKTNKNDNENESLNENSTDGMSQTRGDMIRIARFWSASRRSDLATNSDIEWFHNTLAYSI